MKQPDELRRGSECADQVASIANRGHDRTSFKDACDERTDQRLRLTAIWGEQGALCSV